jgi:hypothetical protein
VQWLKTGRISFDKPSLIREGTSRFGSDGFPQCKDKKSKKYKTPKPREERGKKK